MAMNFNDIPCNLKRIIFNFNRHEALTIKYKRDYNKCIDDLNFAFTINNNNYNRIVDDINHYNPIDIYDEDDIDNRFDTYYNEDNLYNDIDDEYNDNYISYRQIFINYIKSLDIY